MQLVQRHALGSLWVGRQLKRNATSCLAPTRLQPLLHRHCQRSAVSLDYMEGSLVLSPTMSSSSFTEAIPQRQLTHILLMSISSFLYLRESFRTWKGNGEETVREQRETQSLLASQPYCQASSITDKSFSLWEEFDLALREWNKQHLWLLLPALFLSKLQHVHALISLPMQQKWQSTPQLAQAEVLSILGNLQR